MSEYHISRIFYNDRREMKKLDALLEKEGIAGVRIAYGTIVTWITPSVYTTTITTLQQQAPALPTPSDAWPWIPVIRGKVF